MKAYVTELHAEQSLPKPSAPRAVRRVAATLAGMLTCATSLAGPSSIVIRLDGIDLTRPEGVSMVYERIRLAASKVCLNLLLDYGPSASTAYDDCVDRATETAVRTINRKMRPMSQARASRPEDPVSPGS